mgnify:CR=1 FL=1
MIPEHCRGGWLGGHQDFGAATNGWNFVTAGSSRDAINTEEVLVELNRVGFDGALSIEWEDNDVDKRICRGEGLRLLLDFRMTELLVSGPKLLTPEAPRGVK